MVLLFDFDSTMFFLFKNYDRKPLVLKLNNTLKKYGLEEVSDRNFFNCFLSAKDNKECLKEINEIIVEAELDAVDKGYHVDGFKEIFPILLNKYSIGIVSNNSKECIDKYMEKYHNGLSLPFFGRIPLRADLLKPNPYLLEQALKYFNVKKEECLYIGDNFIDYLAANEIGIPFLGMAYLERKQNTFKENNIPYVKNYYELMEVLK